MILACHPDQSLALLEDPGAEEATVLSALRYHPNRAVLHTDTRVLPRRRRTWASWNYTKGCPASESGAGGGPCVHYWLNALQPLPFETPLFVSLNPVQEPEPAKVLGRFEHSHPLLDLAVEALDEIFGGRSLGRSTPFAGGSSAEPQVVEPIDRSLAGLVTVEETR